MNFTHRSYEYMIDLLKSKGYNFSNYTTYKEFNKTVILRHDVDFTLEKALELAKIENSMNINSTYFVLLSTNFYNIFSKESGEILSELLALGHEIGLHFDEKRYEILNKESLDYYVNEEIDMLNRYLGKEIKTVSMHRPSKWILENDVQFKGLINTYSNFFFKDFKYLSDSRMHWRENVLEIIDNKSFDKLHILTHPFWYSEREETMKEKLINFINNSRLERFNNAKDNFKNLEDVLRLGDL